MAVSTTAFTRQLDTLRKHHTLLHLSDWIEQAQSGRPLPKSAVAVTFDDGWADNYEHAFPLLAHFDIPATLFLATDYIGTNRWFWPERLSRLIVEKHADIRCNPDLNGIRELLPGNADTNHLTRSAINRAIVIAKSLSDARIRRRIETAENITGLGQPKTRLLLSWEEVRRMATSGLVELGSHTRTHQRLNATLSRSSLSNEIVDSGARITRETGVKPPLFCYPNGDRSSEAEELVRKHYSGACTTIHGCNSNRADPYRIARIGIHQGIGTSTSLFRFNLACLKR